MKNNHYRFKKTLRETLYGDIILASHHFKTFAIKRIHLAATQQHCTLQGHQSVPENAELERQVNRQLALDDAPCHHTLPLLDEFEENGYMHLVFPYCRRGDLFAKLDREGALPPTQSHKYFVEIVTAVAHLHRLGYAHMDISLENVLLNTKDSCQLCDFGLVAPLCRKKTESVGKLFYMAPEVYAGTPYEPEPADMWSLGIVLFIMCTGFPLGETPSSDDSRFAYFARHGLRALLDAWEVMIPAPLLEIVDALLCIEPEMRLTMKELQAKLGLLIDPQC